MFWFVKGERNDSQDFTYVVAGYFHYDGRLFDAMLDSLKILTYTNGKYIPF